MSCPSNKKKWWIFEYEGSCSYEDTNIKASFTGEYHVKYRCTRCKAEGVSNFVSVRSLIRQGYDVDKLQSLSHFDSKSASELLREDT